MGVGREKNAHRNRHSRLSGSCRSSCGLRASSGVPLKGIIMIECIKLPYADTFVLRWDGVEILDTREGHYGIREFPTEAAAWDFAEELFQF